VTAERATDGKAARIVLALDAAAREGTALEIARCLAGGRLDELLGLVIEDARVLGHARSRIAREVMLSGLERPLEAAALARQLRAQAESARRRLESSAVRLGLRFRAEVARGELLEALTHGAAHAETLVVGESLEAAGFGAIRRSVLHALALADTRSVLFARTGWHTGTSVIAIAEPTGGASAELRVARALAEQSRSPLRLLIAAGEDVTEAALTAIRERILAELGPLPAGSVLVAPRAPAALAAATERLRARLVVLPWTGEETNEPYADLLERTRSAVLLVR